jgi:hypothetical protein
LNNVHISEIEDLDSVKLSIKKAIDRIVTNNTNRINNISVLNCMKKHELATYLADLLNKSKQ